MAGKTALDLLEEGADQMTITQLSSLLTRRADLKREQEEVVNILSGLNIAIANVMGELKIKNFTGLEGTLVYKPAGVGKTLNKKRLVTNLLDLKIDPATVNAALESAYDPKPRPQTVSFYMVGQKEEEYES